MKNLVYRQSQVLSVSRVGPREPLLSICYLARLRSSPYSKPSDAWAAMTVDGWFSRLTWIPSANWSQMTQGNTVSLAGKPENVTYHFQTAD